MGSYHHRCAKELVDKGLGLPLATGLVGGPKEELRRLGLLPRKSLFLFGRSRGPRNRVRPWNLVQKQAKHLTNRILELVVEIELIVGRQAMGLDPGRRFDALALELGGGRPHRRLNVHIGDAVARGRRRARVSGHHAIRQHLVGYASSVGVLGPQRLGDGELAELDLSVNEVQTGLLDAEGGLGHVLFEEERPHGRPENRLDDGGIVPPFEGNPHVLEDKVVGILLVHEAGIALLAQHQHRVKDLVKLEIVGRLEDLRHEFAGLAGQVNDGLAGLPPCQGAHVKLDKEGIRVSVDDLGLATGVPRLGPVKGLDDLLGEQDLLAAIGRDGGCQVLESDLEGPAAELPIEGIGRELVGQLFGIEQGLAAWVGLGRRLFPLGLAGGEQTANNGGQHGLGAIEGLGVATDTCSDLDLDGMLALVLGVGSQQVKGNVRVAIVGQGLIGTGSSSAGSAHQSPIQPIVLAPDERVVANVFALNRRRIQGGEIRHADGGLGIEAGHRVEHNGALVGIVLFGGLARRARQNGNERVALSARPEQEALGLDALPPRKDVADGDTADVRHRHAVVEDLQLLVELEDEVAVLETVLADEGPVRRRAPMKAENVGRADVVLDNDPLGGKGELGLVQHLSVFAPDFADRHPGPLHRPNHHLVRHGFARLVQEAEGPAGPQVLDGPAERQHKTPIPCCSLFVSLQRPRQVVLGHLVQLVRGQRGRPLDVVIEVNLESPRHRPNVHEIVAEGGGTEALFLALDGVAEPVEAVNRA